MNEHLTRPVYSARVERVPLPITLPPMAAPGRGPNVLRDFLRRVTRLTDLFGKTSALSGVDGRCSLCGARSSTERGGAVSRPSIAPTHERGVSTGTGCRPAIRFIRHVSPKQRMWADGYPATPRFRLAGMEAARSALCSVVAIATRSRSLMGYRVRWSSLHRDLLQVLAISFSRSLARRAPGC